jgi:hypothetical protein
MSVFDDWYPHRCDVETAASADEWGVVTATSHPDVACLIEDGAQLVRSSDGAQVQSTSRVHVALDKASWFTPGSVVTVRGSRLHVAAVEIVDDDADLAGATVQLS